MCKEEADATRGGGPGDVHRAGPGDAVRILLAGGAGDMTGALGRRPPGCNIPL